MQAKSIGGETVPPSLLCGRSLSQQSPKQHGLEMCKGLTGGQTAKQAFGDFWTAHIVESRLKFRPREVICHIKDVTAILCHVSTAPE